MKNSNKRDLGKHTIENKGTKKTAANERMQNTKENQSKVDKRKKTPLKVGK
jgi:hypothetical protein